MMKLMFAIAGLAAIVVAACAPRSANRGGTFSTGEEFQTGQATSYHGGLLKTNWAPGTHHGPLLRPEEEDGSPEILTPGEDQEPGNAGPDLIIPRKRNNSTTI